MISRSLYLDIILRVSVMILISILAGYLITRDQSLRLPIVCLIAVAALAISLVRHINTTNRKIKYFFDSVRNDDSSLLFPVEGKNRFIREIYSSMNNINQQIRQLKIKNTQQEQYFRKILEHLATGIITYDNRGFVLHANTSARMLLSTEALNHLQQIERFDERLYRSIKSLSVPDRRLVGVNTKQGEIQLLLKSTSFGTGENQLIILSIQDIKHELDEKEVESWMRLIRVVVHEIMNSITPITSLSEYLSNIYCRDGKSINPEKVTKKTIATTLQGLNVIKEQGKGLLAFVESFRKLTRIPKPELKTFRVSELFSRVKILSNALVNNKNVEISFHLANPELEIFADENLISLVLINLIKNAIEANEKNRDCRINIIAGHGPGHKPEICVSDNGPGISKENLPQIFIPFFTTRKNGSGIGLSISKQIMGAHGGTLKVRSTPDKETIFCMSFQN